MAFRNRTVTIKYCGEEEPDLIDAYLAGLRLRAWLQSHSNEPEGPEGIAISSPSVDEENNGTITIPDFDPEPEVAYTLEYSDDDWFTITTYADVTPDTSIFCPHAVTRRYRINARIGGNNIYGPSTGLVP